MRKHITEIVSFVTLVAFLLGGYVFLDAKHAQAAELVQFKAEVTKTFSEDALDDQYYRLEIAEFNLEDDPDDERKKRRIAMIMRNIDRLLARIDRDAGVQ